MKKFIGLLAVLAFATVIGFAQDKKDMPAQEKKEAKVDMMKPHAMTGYLVDMMCGKRMGNGDVEKSSAKAAKHTTKCALDEACAESGYGLVYEGKWAKFDEAGDKMAAAWLQKTDKKDNLLVEVTGTMSGDMFKVTGIKPVAEKKADMKKEDKMEKKDDKMEKKG